VLGCLCLLAKAASLVVSPCCHMAAVCLSAFVRVAIRFLMVCVVLHN
jgi:hypothetical protein